MQAWVLRHNVLSCLQGTFCIKQNVLGYLLHLLEKSYLSISLASRDPSKQSLQLQVFIHKCAFANCASGRLLPMAPGHFLLEGCLEGGWCSIPCDAGHGPPISTCSSQASLVRRAKALHPLSCLQWDECLLVADPQDYGRKSVLVEVRECLSWLLPQHSARAMPDSGSVLPTSPRHQAAHAVVSLLCHPSSMGVRASGFPDV